MNAEGRLRQYHSVATMPGFPRAVAGVIAELRLARISLDVIGACGPGLEPLIGAFEIELKEAGVTDWSGVLSLASEAASDVGGNRPRLIGLPTLLLDVPIGNEAEFAFVESLTAAATEVLATVPTADQATLRRIRDRLHAQIEDLDSRSVGDEIGASATSASALTNLQRRLFKEEERPIEAKPDHTVEVFSAPGEGRECVEIARRVLSAARRGVPFDRIAVLLRSSRGGIQPGRHSDSFCAWGGSARSRRTRLLCASQVRGRWPVSTAIRGVPFARTSSGCDVRRRASRSDSRQRTLGIPRFRVCSILD
jgi:ATP-dependent helicase/nuclease subunit B